MRASLVLALLLASGTVGAQTTPAAPDCWPAQIGGAGSLASVATNALGWALYWECPAPSTNGPFMVWGHWSETAGNWRSQLGSLTTAGSGVLWTQLSNSPGDFSPQGQYFDIAALVKGLANTHHPGLMPLLADQGADVFSPIKSKDVVTMVRVGSVSAKAQCDGTQTFSVGGAAYAVVPATAVTLVNPSVQPTALVAACY